MLFFLIKITDFVLQKKSILKGWINTMKTLDLNKLTDKKNIIVSSEKALKDVTPINWSDDVLSGKKKVKVMIL